MTTTAAYPGLASAANFRDLGGLPTLCGKRIRHGLLYRSEAFDIVTREDMAALAERNIRLICDLRSISERQRRPNLWPVQDEVPSMYLNITADLRAKHAAISELLANNPTVAGAHQAMLLTYRLLPEAFADALPAFIESICQPQLPVVFHCAAGKDRTGFVAALLLRALNVDSDLVLDDYLQSNRYWCGERATASMKRHLQHVLGIPPTPDVVNVMCGVHPSFLQAALETIDEQFGSLENYFEVVGLTRERIATLRELCLE
jgi:protein-tyrosine phosphatase